MKVVYKKSVPFKIDIVDPRRIGRALRLFVQNGHLAKLGYGLYATLYRSKITQPTYLKEGTLPAMRATLDRLNIHWEPSCEEQNCQTRRSTQTPANPNTVLKDRLRHRLCYFGMDLKHE